MGTFKHKHKTICILKNQKQIKGQTTNGKIFAANHRHLQYRSHEKCV